MTLNKTFGLLLLSVLALAAVVTSAQAQTACGAGTGIGGVESDGRCQRGVDACTTTAELCLFNPDTANTGCACVAAATFECDRTAPQCGGFCDRGPGLIGGTCQPAGIGCLCK